MVEAGSIYLIDKQFWGFYRVDPTMNMTYLLTRRNGMPNDIGTLSTTLAWETLFM